MSFKIVFKDETKRVAPLPESFASLREAIKRAFKEKVPFDFVVKYLDPDSDMITVTNEEDFKVMLEVSKEHPIKVFVLNNESSLASSQVIQTEQRPSTTLSEGMVILDENPKEFEMKSSGVLTDRRKEVENQVRKELQRKAEEKAKRKREVRETQGKLLEIQGKKIELKKQLLDIQAELIDLKRKIWDKETATEKEQAEFDEQKISLKAAKKVLNEELSALKPQAKELKRALRHLKHKKEGHGGRHCPRKFLKEFFGGEGPRHHHGHHGGPAVHRRVQCDGCQAFPIVGNRYKCQVCADFDYCDSCYNNKVADHGHSFAKIERPQGFGGFGGCRPGGFMRFLNDPQLSGFINNIFGSFVPKASTDSTNVSANQSQCSHGRTTNDRIDRILQLFPHFDKVLVEKYINENVCKTDDELVSDLLDM